MLLTKFVGAAVGVAVGETVVEGFVGASVGGAVWVRFLLRRRPLGASVAASVGT